MAKTPDRRKDYRTATQLLEEAVALLRRTPFSALVSYYFGAIPFWLAVLYFISDMSQNGFAQERLAPESFTLAVLFIWMKCWHCVFTARLRSELMLEGEVTWSAGRITRMILAQAAIQPVGLFVRPTGLILLLLKVVPLVKIVWSFFFGILGIAACLPAVWISSFYHTAMIVGDGTDLGGDSVMSRAWARARLWPRQAFAAALMLFVFGIFVWVNVAVLLGAVPHLMKMFVGVDTMLTRSGAKGFLNTTFLTATWALTMLCMDPLWKALYVLRCFYGDSLHSGDDLRVWFRRLRADSVRVAALGVAIVTFSAGSISSSLHAAEPAPASGAVAASASNAAPSAAPSVDPEKLNNSIDRVLDQREFAWRMPIPPGMEKESASKGLLGSWFDDVERMISKAIKKGWAWIKKIYHWLFPNRRHHEESSGGHSGELPWKAIMYTLIAAAVGLIAWSGWRMWKTRTGAIVTAEVVKAMPDLHSDDVLADQLPEDGWLSFARELMEKGDFRLALRAAYLACLAHLGERQLLTIARYKSNREYDRELQRRARSRDELLSAFGENLNVFERVWYGSHEATRDTLTDFTRNLEKIRTC